MNMGLFWGIILAIMLFSVPIATAQICHVLAADEWQPDGDCDGVSDIIDNCPDVANSQQRDLNRNGLGDACDLLVEEIIVSPDGHLRQGEFAYLTVRLLNNHNMPLEDITVTVRNRELGIDASQNLAYLPVGETAVTDFWLSIPKCADVGSYPLSISSTVEGNTVEVQRETIFVDENNVCGTPAGPLDTTIINVLGKIDVDRGERALLPIKILNLGDDQETYHASLEDLGRWGSWRIDPEESILLPEGHSSNLFLYVETTESTPAGKKTLYLTISSENQKTVIPIDFYVRVTRQIGISLWDTLLKWFFILVLMLLIGIVGIIAIAYFDRKIRRDTFKPRKKVSVEKVKDSKVKTHY